MKCLFFLFISFFYMVLPIYASVETDALNDGQTKSQRSNLTKTEVSEVIDDFESVIYEDVRNLCNRVLKTKALLKRVCCVFEKSTELTPDEGSLVDILNIKTYTLREIVKNFSVLMSSFQGRLTVLAYMFEIDYARRNTGILGLRLVTLLQNEPFLGKGHLNATEIFAFLPIKTTICDARREFNELNMSANRITRYYSILSHYTLSLQLFNYYSSFHQNKLFFKALNCHMPTDYQEGLRLFRGEEREEEEVFEKENKSLCQYSQRQVEQRLILFLFVLRDCFDCRIQSSS